MISYQIPGGEGEGEGAGVTEGGTWEGKGERRVREEDYLTIFPPPTFVEK